MTIENPWTLGGTRDLPARIDFVAGSGVTGAVISGGPLALGGPTFQHATVRALSGDGSFDVPVEIHPNAHVLVVDGMGIDFNQATTIHGGVFESVQLLFPFRAVDFNGQTEWRGNATIIGYAHQYGDATVSQATVIQADVFNMDGTESQQGTPTTWNIGAALEVNAQQIDVTNNRFDGTFDIGGPIAARLAINLTDPQAAWEMAGTMNLSGVPFGFANRVAGSRMVVTGQLNVQQRTDISADTTLAAGSTTDIDASSHLLRMSGITVVEPGATITGDGYLQNAASGDMSLPVGLSTGNVGLANEGFLRLGDAVGVISVEEFVQSAGATLVVDVGRNTMGTDSDVLTTSSGAALVAGFVQPNMVNIGGTFVEPQVGDTFTILTAVGGISGMFDDVLDASLGGMTYSWTLIHNMSNVQIQLANVGGLLGDYNLDGAVDAADYTVWRNTLGSTTNLAADGNKNGTVDAGDYGVWKDHYGATLVGSGSFENVAVPEPNFAAILTCGLLFVNCRRLWR